MFKELFLTEAQVNGKYIDDKIQKIYKNAKIEYNKWNDISDSDNVSLTEYNPSEDYKGGQLTVTYEDGSWDLYHGNDEKISPTSDEKKFFNDLEKYIRKVR